MPRGAAKKKKSLFSSSLYLAPPVFWTPATCQALCGTQRWIRRSPHSIGAPPERRRQTRAVNCKVWWGCRSGCLGRTLKWAETHVQEVYWDQPLWGMKAAGPGRGRSRTGRQSHQRPQSTPVELWSCSGLWSCPKLVQLLYPQVEQSSNVSLVRSLSPNEDSPEEGLSGELTASTSRWERCFCPVQGWSGSGRNCARKCFRVSLMLRMPLMDFPGGAVVENPPANAGDMGSSPGPGRSHMPRSN